MQLCHLNCFDVEAGWGGEEKNNRTQSLPFVYQENKGLKLPPTTALFLVFSPRSLSWTQTHSQPLSQSHTQNTLARQLGFPEMGQDKSRQFLLSITR